MRLISNLWWYFLVALIALIVIVGFAAILYFSVTAFIYVIVIFYLINFLTVVIIFSQKRQSIAKLSWILAITVLPLLGHLLYFSLGQKYPHRRDYIVVKQETTEMDIEANTLELSHLNNQIRNTYEHLAYFLKSQVKDCDLRIYEHPWDYFKKMLEAIDNAQQEINIVMYIMEDGFLLQQFLNRLIKKRKEGVEVRILVDDFGRRNTSRKIWRELARSGIEINFIGQLKFTFFLSSNIYRNHRKFIIIDRQIVFNGGSNIGDSYVSLEPKYGYYQDTNTSLSGPYVRRYVDLFMQMWFRWARVDLRLFKYRTGDTQLIEVKPDNESLMLLATGGPEINDPVLEETIIKLINRSQRSIRLATPYFSMTTEMASAIKVALMSGVEVTLYFPAVSSFNVSILQRLVATISNFEMNELVDYGLRVVYSAGNFNHSKIGVFDEEIAYIGSMNLDIRSFYAQYENIDVITGNGVSALSKALDNFDTPSNLQPIHRKHNKHLNWPKRILFNLLKSIV